MQQRIRQSNTKNRSFGVRLRAFTLIELIVVIAIIGILSALVVPGASSLWSQRNEAASANLIRGLLQSVRTQAIRYGERGLFFYVDRDGAQRIAFIEADPSFGGTSTRDQFDCTNISEPTNCVSEPGAANRFRVIDQQVYTVPSPFRVAPSWALYPDNAPYNPNLVGVWPQQLTNERFPIQTRGADTPLYHRNFFTIVFDSTGSLVVNRPVLIHDIDTENDGLGDRTRLDVADVDEWWKFSPGDAAATQPDVDPINGNPLFDIVALDNGTGANFISVDGLVVYDDSDIEGLDGASIRAVMERDGQSLFVSRYTGEVIFGPKG